MEVPLKTYIPAPNLPPSSLESNESKMEAFISAELANRHGKLLAWRLKTCNSVSYMPCFQFILVSGLKVPFELTAKIQECIQLGELRFGNFSHFIFVLFNCFINSLPALLFSSFCTKLMLMHSLTIYPATKCDSTARIFAVKLLCFRILFVVFIESMLMI